MISFRGPYKFGLFNNVFNPNGLFKAKIWLEIQNNFYIP